MDGNHSVDDDDDAQFESSLSIEAVLMLVVGGLIYYHKHCVWDRRLFLYRCLFGLFDLN